MLISCKISCKLWHARPTILPNVPQHCFCKAKEHFINGPYFAALQIMFGEGKKKTLTVVLCSLLFVGSSHSSTTNQTCYSRWFQCSANTLVIVLKTCNGECETCSLKENKRFIIPTIPERSSSTHSLPRLAHESSITFLS